MIAGRGGVLLLIELRLRFKNGGRMGGTFVAGLVLCVVPVYGSGVQRNGWVLWLQGATYVLFRRLLGSAGRPAHSEGWQQ